MVAAVAVARLAGRRDTNEVRWRKMVLTSAGQLKKPPMETTTTRTRMDSPPSAALHFANPYPPVPPEGWSFDPAHALGIGLAAARAVLRSSFSHGSCIVDDPFPYTGSAGMADSLLRLSLCATLSEAEKHHFLDGAVKMINHAVVQAGSSRSALLCGTSGVIVTAAAVCAAMGNYEKAVRYCHSYASIADAVCADSANEILYGKAGYVVGGCLLDRALGGNPVPSRVLEVVTSRILAEGVEYSRSHHHDSPLMYAWPERRPREYAGAAHGILGILYALLLRTPTLAKHQIDTVSHTLRWALHKLESKAFPGHFHTHAGDEDDGHKSKFRVHWCHGATGAVFTFTQAHLSLCGSGCKGDCAWMGAAGRAATVVWNEGLLRKGPGLCHGISGNGYALLRMHRVTGDPVYLYRAECFARFLDSRECVMESRRPDTPYSEFEGLSGAVAFCADLARLHQSSHVLPVGFPFFEVLDTEADKSTPVKKKVRGAAE